MSAAANWVAAGHTAPIIYLPMDDPATAHVNQGTGGNFTLNGTIARSGRGPNQFNVAYSDLDGAADYLSRTTALVGAVDGKQFTLSFQLQTDSISTQQDILSADTGTQYRGIVRINSSGKLYFSWDSPDYVTYLIFTSTDALVIGRNYNVVISIDMSSASKRHVLVNGSTISGSWSYSDYALHFNVSNWSFGRYIRGNNSFVNGRLGNVFFDTKYIDLSQPANLAKFVTGTGIDAKPADLGANGELPFGTSPLIYLPMYGNNAGKNYGTGGDFTVNSGPYPGARGPNEFWGNNAKFTGGTNGWLYRTSALTGVTDSKTVSCSFYITPTSLGTGFYVFAIQDAVGNYAYLSIERLTTNVVYVRATNTSGVVQFSYTSSGTITSGSTFHIAFSFDLANSSNRSFYLNGVSDGGIWGTYNNIVLPLTGPQLRVGSLWNANATEGSLSEFYFTTDYIDFSQEANRLLFRDAFGNPTDLPAAIAKGTVPNPAIYMRFDPADQGKNSGTGGNFTKSGTINDGGQL